MSTAIAVFHGAFGRAALYRLNRPLAPHAHREGHLIFLVRGAAGSVAVDGVRHVVHPGQSIAISPWQPHDFQPGDFGEGALFLTLYIKPRWFEELSRAMNQAMRFGAPTLKLDAEMRGRVERIAEILASGHQSTALAEVTGLTRAAFDRTWMPRFGGIAAGLGPAPSVRDFRIRNALALMNERVADVCALDRIARDAGMSRPHFYKLFRQNLGVTPNMYLNTLRLERSIDRLVWSSDAVTSIGLDLGFASQASFTRFFSNNVGIAPTDFRRCSMVSAAA
ncbi:AraC family transcriptional regulator [Acuticoccus sp. I52.16.1]|uniref:helix-turn-helix transcriptional regulator n=1 Tax=Acuticoccus sp. I52.16.1 TaxID=2928472 RepID=UPI001FD41A35|nr:AraC family transcriptional regulator [Acuticoccus sp. I52.16.1]UOM34985.1 AraC family transcriptional regulator [Acuticoccus sp. I52.16.1]